MPIHTMPFKVTDTVGEIVARRPALSRLFEQAGIDYCCGGKKPLEEACRKKRIDSTVFLAALEEAAAKAAEEPVADVLSMSPTELAEHIEQTHHVYLKSELPRVGALAEKVAAVHGENDSRLVQVKETFQQLARELIPHLTKEEEDIFPKIKSGDFGGSLSEALRLLESEHDQVGAALARLRELTDGYVPPSWACGSYRALLDALARLEHDMHQHVHKENNVLFPRVREASKKKSS